MLKDQVCGMIVTLETAEDTREFEDVTYGFCSKHCLETFDNGPGRYAVLAKKQTHNGIPR